MSGASTSAWLLAGRWVRCASLVGVVVASLSVGSGVAAATSKSAYVPNDLTSGATVSQFDIGAGGALSPKTPATAAADMNPDGIAIAPDGASVYVTDAGSGHVSQYDVGTGGLLSPKTPATVAAGTSPLGIAVSPDGKSVYVANQGSGSISQYDVGSGGALSPKTPAAVIVGPTSLQQVAVSPDGQSVYVTNFGGGGEVLQYDVGSGGVLSPKTPASAASGTFPEGIAVSPDGTSVYVVNRGDKDVALFHVGATGALSKVGTTVAGSDPTMVAVSPDGKSVYVVDRNGGGTGAVLQYDVGAGGVLSPKTPAAVAAGTSPFGIAVSPDGKSVYVSDAGSSDVSQYDVGAGGLLSPKTPATVAAGLNPIGIAVLPDQGPVASFAVTAAPAGTPTTFDGSASSDADGTIARYDWNFGDGTTAANGGPTPTHTYAAPGAYTVTLTVTDDGGCSSAFVFTGQTAFCNGGPGATKSATVTVTKATPPAHTNVSLTNVGQSHRRWRRGSRLPRIARVKRPPVGTTFRFTVNESVKMRLAFTQRLPGRRVKGHCVAPTRKNRHKPACTRTLTRGRLSFNVGTGAHMVRFQGRISKHKKLAPGRYTLTITATNSAAQQATAKLTFTIVNG